MTASLTDVFSRMTLHTDGVEYVLVSLPRHRLQTASVLFTGLAEALSVMILDKNEITLVLRAEDWDLARPSAPEARSTPGYRLITLDLPMGLDQTGILATVSNLLAEANVPLFAISAYERDHLLVRRDDFERAWSILSNLIAQYRRPSLH
jgi:hypothetical protein